MSGTSAVIPAAGRGERFGRGSNKVFAEVVGKPILAHTLLAFEKCRMIDDIVLVVGKHEIIDARKIADTYGISKLRAVVAGGNHRQDSVENGLAVLDPSTHIVAVHDGARPLVRPETIVATIRAAEEFEAAVAAVPVIDTIKSADSDGFVASTLDRSNLWSIQTPQTFDKNLLESAYSEARKTGFYATDDAALVERLGHRVKLVMGCYDNIKITTPLDQDFMETRLNSMQINSMLRTGFGYDIHRFEEGRKLVLGGVEFPGEVGLEGHSDADVILHAIADALLGAAVLGDIGRHFPNTDPKYRGISSLVLLEHTAKLIADAGWKVANVDATLVAERPKIADKASEMQEKIAASLGVAPDQVSIKATTAEKLGDIGAGAGAACYAVAAIFRS